MLPKYLISQEFFAQVNPLKGETGENSSLLVKPDLHWWNQILNLLMNNVPKWSGTLWKSCSICLQIFKVCLASIGTLSINGLSTEKSFNENKNKNKKLREKDNINKVNGKN